MALLNRIFFRADGNSQIGLGHVIRSLALANMLQQDFECIFIIQNPSSALHNQIREVCSEIFALPHTHNYSDEAIFIALNYLQPTDIIVLDGYFFDTTYQQNIKNSGAKLVCIDDIQSFAFVSDVIINQAGGVNKNKYLALPETKFCLGPAYALLRPPFLKAASEKREITQINWVFINMGGADPENHTLKISQKLLSEYPDLQLYIVTGGAYQYLSDLENLISGNVNIKLHQQLSAAEICSLMQQCDAAIIPPSSVSYEWCAVSGPLFLVKTADNQTNIYNFLISEELAFDLVDFKNIINHPDSSDLIQAQILKQKQYFDGRSASRLRTIFYQLLVNENLKLREAINEDALVLYDWINDPAVRANSFNQEPIPLEIHKIWFKNKLADSACIILIAEISDQKAGMVRYDIRENTATISYLLQENFRGKGLGTLILEKGTQYIKTHLPTVKILIGHVQESNIASVNSFYKAGFQLTENRMPVQANALVFEKQLN